MGDPIPEPFQKCMNCGQPTVAWILVEVIWTYMKPEDHGTGKMRPGSGSQPWCLDCIRGKNDPKWLHAKPWENKATLPHY